VLNLAVGSGVLWFAVLMFFGIGLSSNPETDRQVLGCVWVTVLVVPFGFNLAVAIAAFALGRRQFLAGWGLGFLLGLGGVLLQVATLAAWLFLLSRSPQ